MFEHTLAGAIPAERNLRFGPVSIAVVVHATILVAIVVVSVFTLRPPAGPTPPLIVVLPPRMPDLDAASGGGSQAPRRESPARSDPTPTLPRPPEQPQPEPDVPTELEPLIPADSADTALDGQGSASGEGLSSDGSGDGTGTGSGSGTGEGNGEGDGTGNGSGSGPVSLGPGIASPRLIVKVQPDYPSIARRSRLEGEVVLRAVVGPDGSVTSVVVVRSTSPMFNDAALDAVRRWRYTPPSQEGRPVSVWLDIVVRFNLR